MTMSTRTGKSSPRVLLLTHAPRHSRLGNRITALRWAAFIRRMGWRVRIINHYQQQPAELMIALNARRNQTDYQAFADSGNGALILALTGTDSYAGWPDAEELHFAEHHVSAVIALQDDMRQRLPTSLRNRCTVIYQSAVRLDNERVHNPIPRFLLSGHLRAEKAPFLPVQAIHEQLPAMDLLLMHCGGIIDAGMGDTLQQWQQREPRYHYLGELPHRQALQQLQQADALINPSRIEGGPAVVTEAIVAGVPVLASDIPAHRGLLGEDYLGFFTVDDPADLARRIADFVEREAYRERLRQQIIAREPFFQSEHECACLQRLLRSVVEQTHLKEFSDD